MPGMTPQRQRQIEDVCDIVAAAGVLALLAVCLLLLPRSFLWFWLVPLGLFWWRWNYVRARRERLLDAKLFRDRPFGASNGDGSDSRIGIPDRTKHGTVAGDHANAARQFRLIGRRK